MKKHWGIVRLLVETSVDVDESLGAAIVRDTRIGVIFLSLGIGIEDVGDHADQRAISELIPPRQNRSASALFSAVPTVLAIVSPVHSTCE